jgi:oligoendopeptidase F
MSTTTQSGPWSLEDLFDDFDSPEVTSTLEDLEARAQQFEAYRAKLSTEPSADLLLEILQAYEDAVKLLSQLLGYGQLRFYEDTQNQEAQTFLGQIQQLAAQWDNRTLFFKLWWKGLEEKTATKLMDAVGDYAYWLEALRLQKPYTLSEAEEKVVNLKDVNGPVALVNLYNSITNRYTYKMEVDGEIRELTRGELHVYYRDPDPAMRAAAYKELLRIYENDASILGQIYQYRVRDWRSENIGLRGYTSPVAVRNLGNNIPDDVVKALLDACRENASVFHRFFRLKAKWLGVDKIRRYDVYAPVVKADKTYTFAEGIELIRESFQKFDPRFAELACKILDENHLDSEVRKGKSTGAFCATLTPDLTPWVQTSFQGRPDDVATLAHELGHAVHSLLSDHHTALTHDASLPLAETASTFGEMILVDHMLEQDPDPAVQRDLLFRQMDDAYATIMRQAYFAIYELSAHELIQSGASVEQLSQAYMENLQDQFGNSLTLSEDYGSEWLAIPHIYHTPFYVYAYAFGQLLVLSLYQQYQAQGDAFKPRYMAVLEAGGSDAPMRILEKAGVDVRSPAFWQGGFDVLLGLLEQLEAIEVSE